jgi:hypothetical protein
MKNRNYFQYLEKFLNRRHLALNKKIIGEPEYKLYVRAARAIKDCLDFLFAHIQYQGCAKMEQIKKGDIGAFTPEEKLIFQQLADETALKVAALKEKVFQIILCAYIRLYVQQDLSGPKWDHYRDIARSAIKAEILHYADWSGFMPNNVNQVAKIIFDYLAMILPVPRFDNAAKDDLKENYMTGLAFCRSFFLYENEKVETKRKISEFEEILNAAQKEKFSDVLQDFSFAAKKTDRIASRRFCKACEGRYENLAEFLNQSEDRVLRASIGVGNKGLTLFKEFIKTKGYRFAEWNGKENV